MKDKISAVAGLSGVGKSALLNALQPGLRLRTQGVHERRGGRHTTAAIELFKLDFGGFVADTPGIRSLSTLDIEAGKIDSYFPEMRRLREGCEKNPCTHLHETGCAVKAALEEGRLAQARYKSYCELRNSPPVEIRESRESSRIFL
jgi:ribosome biogenesis GTPase